MKWSCLSFVFVISACLVGCEGVAWKGGALRGDAPRVGAWPFAPREIRVHPFTSIAYDKSADLYVIEARVELLDLNGDATKGVGSFRFELLRSLEPDDVRAESRELMSLWASSIATLEDNAAHYDGITRTYWFRLELHEPLEANARLFLVAHYTDASGQRMTAESVLSLSGLEAASAD